MLNLILLYSKKMMINIFDINKDVYFFLDLENKASGLSVMAQRYRKDAEHLNLRSTYARLQQVLLFL